MKKTLITGGTGLVGRHLVPTVEQAIVATRNPTAAQSIFNNRSIGTVKWNPASESVALNNHEPIHAVVNLMGESLAKGRWNAEKKKRIVESRVFGTENLVSSIEQMETKPEVLVSASAVGYYGDCGDQEITERMQPASGFLADTCVQWEAAARKIEELGVRLVVLRLGIVMAEGGGALAELLPVFRKGLGGRLGDGTQYFPWIHLEDLVSLINWAINNGSVQGIYNAVAPNPVTNREFTSELATVLHRLAILPVPRFALRLALGEFADSLFISQRVIPEAAVRDGFEFKFPNLSDCLSDLLS